ncbi:9954_t:CDS:2 [Funneliformis caledonium]|uniref:9954_t:CDS:1 n=1 Tax=Funneliformis caledonium TaxID=1117310 RepID=A0A9N9FTS3_9GLOM|nr:9954_t:CDS:2 [Funneliformis caledonium]
MERYFPEILEKLFNEAGWGRIEYTFDKTSEAARMAFLALDPEI